MSKLFLTSLAAVAMACATTPTPVTVTGGAADKASLAGRWSGEYQSASTGRSGSIVFNLSSTGEAASGDVIMIPRGYGKALERFDQTGTAGQTTTAGAPSQNTNNSQVLTIKLVRVSGDSVSGALDAYRDPECNCPVETRFTGRVAGDAIDGTFTTRGSQSNAPQTGTWRVRRNR